jgi:hypothetical protein
MKRFSLPLVALALAIGPLASSALVACGDEPEAKDPSMVASTTAPTPTPTPTVVQTATATATATETAPPPKPPPPTVEDMEASADPKPLPSIRVKGLTNEQSIADAAKAKDTAITLDVKNWELGKDGQHVHVILDGNPYKKIMDAKTPIKLGELVPEGKDIAEGQHYLIAFASRGTHESVKGKGSSTFMTFWVGKKAKPAPYDGKKMLLVYSRPKGDNFGDMGKSVMIDFYLVNGTLDKGDKVRFSVNGPGLDQPVTGEFTKWAPKLVKGLQAGEFEVKLELLDKDGKVSDLPWNSFTRKINVDASKPLDPSMGMGPMTMSPTPATSASGATSAKPAPATSASAKSSK